LERTLTSVTGFEAAHPDIAESAWVHGTAVVIGNVTVGADASLWPMTVLRGDVNWIRIGERTNIQDGAILHVTHAGEHAPGGFPLLVGNDVTVGHRVILHGCTVGDLCLIGMGAIVMDGAVIGERTIIGAGSLVPGGRKLEGGYLYVGSPARKVRALSAEELLYLEYSARHYVKLKERHRVAELSG
jgi:carbonic anhydrase/acetyltransferase-like protein (isoleucine patch superfamily)